MTDNIQDKQSIIAKARRIESDGDLFRFHEPRQAETAYSQAIGLLDQAGESFEAARICNDKIGVMYYRKSRFIEALKWWKEAGNRYEQLGDGEHNAAVFNRIGVIYKKLTDYSRSLEYYKRSLELSRKHGDSTTEMKTLNNLGLIYKELGHFSRAQEYLEQSLSLKRKNGQNLGVANTLVNLGNLHKNMHNYHEARRCMEEAITIFNSLKNAEPYVQDDVQQGIAAAMHDLGNTFLGTNDLNAALQHYKESLVLNQRFGKSLSICADYQNIGDAYLRMGYYENSRIFLNHALEMAEAMGLDYMLQKIHTSFGDLYTREKKWKQSVDHYKTAVELVENVRKKLMVASHQAGYLNNLLHIYEKIILILLKLGRDADAFEYLEMMKARTLLDYLETGNILLENVMTEEERMKERKLVSELESLNHSIASLRTVQEKEFKTYCKMREKKRLELDQFEEELFVRHPELKELHSTGEPLTLRKAQMLLSRDESAVYYLMSHDGLIIVIVSRNDLSVCRTDTSAETIAKLADKLLKRVVQWDEKSASELFRILLKPILPFVKTQKRLCIIPEGKLNYLPFHALKNPETGKYLIEDFAVYYAPSLSTLKSVRSIGNYGTGSLLALGNPDFDGGKSSSREWRDRILPLAPLPATQDEVTAIEKIYSPKARILTSSDATKSGFFKYAPQYGVLHFATHALTDENSPMYSAIALSKEKGEFGFLEAREIVQMELNADLVVLSACKTAYGSVLEGEGMLGLTRAFFTAGVPTVIATLWNVDDQAAKELMVAFHEKFRNRERPATALRDAQLSLLNSDKFHEPYYWASFILMGDSE